MLGFDSQPGEAEAVALQGGGGGAKTGTPAWSWASKVSEGCILTDMWPEKRHHHPTQGDNTELYLNAGWRNKTVNSQRHGQGWTYAIIPFVHDTNSGKQTLSSCTCMEEKRKKEKRLEGYTYCQTRNPAKGLLTRKLC